MSVGTGHVTCSFCERRKRVLEGNSNENLCDPWCSGYYDKPEPPRKEKR